jgi:hypothetical protein
MKIKFLILFLVLTLKNYAQTLFVTTYRETYSQFKVDPNVSNIDISYQPLNQKKISIFVYFKNGYTYQFHFDPSNEKLFGFSYFSNNNEETQKRFSNEITRRNAQKTSSGHYIFYDPNSRPVYLWLSQDDLGTYKVNIEGKYPIQF